MDIVRVRKHLDHKASFHALAWKQKFFLLLFCISLTSIIIPHETYAAVLPDRDKATLVFDTTNDDYLDYLATLSQEATDKYYQEQLQKQLARHQALVLKVEEYLEAQGSPLAAYAQTLVSLRNWKKIVALSNAESSLCRKYPAPTANCWGVGGSNLWDMGDNLGQGVVSMNHFLNQYPKGKIKYSQMSFERMNGLYKQPPKDHWVYNNQVIYNDLTAIEKSL